MSATAVARRYAEAMADVAFERNIVEQTEDQLRWFAETSKASSELRNLFASPVVSQSDKGKVLEALIARAGTGELTANLLRALLKNYRLQHVQEVHEQFNRIVNERRGAVVAKVTAAAPLSPAELERLGLKLKQLTGKQIEFEVVIDPSLIGGAIARVGSVVYDGSVRTQLLDIQQRLKSKE
jgi:F-type H+-transporting ATPase subunit delta